MSSITAPAARRVVVGAATMHRAAACWSLRGSMIASSSRLQGPTPSPICAFSLWPAQKIAASSPSPSPPKPSSPPDPSSAGPSRASGKDLQRHPSIDRFEPGWAMSHSRYSEEDLDNVQVAHRELKGFGDRAAAAMVNVMRYGFDVATRYPKHRQHFPRVAGSEGSVVQLNEHGKELQRKQAAKDGKQHAPRASAGSGNASSQAAAANATPTKAHDLPEEMTLGEMRRKGLSFGPEQWLVRIVFLESVAGVPGMMAAMARHLHSLRLLRRDKGWIHTLLEDAANERQHLLVALKLYEPGLFMRALLIGAQGVFCNFFFLLYLVAPRVAHRFVGVLEEEAVVTYTRILEDVQAGRLPEWQHYPAPQIAIDYWGLKKEATMVDVVRALRADEANHRYINHTLAELEKDDYNPFAYGDAPADKRGLTWGLTRDEAIQHFEKEDATARARFNEQQQMLRAAAQGSEAKDDSVRPSARSA